MHSRKTLPFTFLIPTTLVLMVIALVPTFYAINISFQDRTLIYPDAGYIGFENYVDLFLDRRFLNALWVSAKWELTTVLATMSVALMLGILMYENLSRRSRAWVCIIFLIPVLLPRVSAAFVWKFAFHPLYGIVTYPYRFLTGDTLDILAEPALALYAVAFVDVWQWSPFFAVIILKLLESLPKEPLEAARLDHTQSWQLHRFVTIPMLKVPIISLVFVKAVESLRSFDLVYIMTRGGPGITTETLDMYAFSQGFIEAGKISYASSMAVIMMAVTIVVFSFIWNRTR